jgi:hypothetical protein
MKVGHSLVRDAECSWRSRCEICGAEVDHDA